MLHPSRILIGLLSLYLISIIFITWNSDIKSSDIQIINPVMIVSEPKVSGSTQSFFVSPVGSNITIDVKTNQFPVYKYGDYLSLSGRVEDVSGSEYAINNPGYYLVNNIKYSIFYPKISRVEYGEEGWRVYWYDFRYRLINIRKSIERNINISLPEPQSGLLSGILLGTRSDLSQETKEVLAKVGIIHIIALSGYNITVVAEAMRLIFRKYSARLAFWGSFFGVWIFVFATGFSASVVRAAIMGSLLLFAQKLGRRSNALVAVLLASTIMVVANPYILLYDIGFQLSFAAVCGILFLAPRIEKYFTYFGKTFGPVLAATVSAQLFTLPIISYYFGRVSLISPLVNLLVVPLIPLIMLIGFIGAVSGYASTWLGGLILTIDWYLLSYIFVVSDFFANTSFSEASYKIPFFYAILVYIILFEIVLILRKRQKNATKNT